VKSRKKLGSNGKKLCGCRSRKLSRRRSPGDPADPVDQTAVRKRWACSLMSSLSSGSLSLAVIFMLRESESNFPPVTEPVARRSDGRRRQCSLFLGCGHCYCGRPDTNPEIQTWSLRYRRRDIEILDGRFTELGRRYRRPLSREEAACVARGEWVQHLYMVVATHCSYYCEVQLGGTGGAYR
jgi:hypothetical protein